VSPDSKHCLPVPVRIVFNLDEVFFPIPLKGVYEGLRKAVSHNDVQLTAVDEDPVPAVQQIL
jgi:molybdopterin-guanine dinucleotide biosynthesis protein A